MSESPTPMTSAPAARPHLSWLLLILANVLWAGSYVSAKFALQDIPLTLMLALRMGISSLILLPLLLVKRKDLHLSRSDIPQLILLAAVGFVINKLLEFGGLALTTASDVALLITSESIFTAALSWILLRERFKWTTGLALLLGFVGVYFIIERSLIPNIPAGGGAWRILGDVLVVLALIFEAFYTVRGKALLTKHSPLLVTAAAITGSVVFWLPAAGIQLWFTGWPAISPLAWVGIAWLALMATVVAYLAWFQGLSKVDGSVAASTLFIQPLLGTLLAILLLNEQLTPYTIIGGLLVIASVSLLSRP